MLWVLLFFLQFLTIIKAVSCPAGTTYESQFKKCYKYYPNATSFLVAEKTCEQNGGNLVSITNAFENSYVSGFVAGNTKVQTYWIGASLLLSTFWSWTSGQGYSYQNWASQQPADPSMYQCAAARDVDYQWTKELCGSTRPFVCQIDLTGASQTFCNYNSPSDKPSTITPTPITGCTTDLGCSPGYTLNYQDCMCYKFDDSVFRSFDNAVQYCAQDSAQLVKITSAEQNSFLVAFTGRTACNGGYCPHIGLKCRNTTASSCYWSDGTPLSGYSNFYPAGVPTEGDFFLNLDSNLIYPIGAWGDEQYGNCATLCQKKSSFFSDLAKERDAKGLTPISTGDHYQNNYKT